MNVDGSNKKTEFRVRPVYGCCVITLLSSEKGI